jgi:hypothetical protein
MAATPMTRRINEEMVMTKTSTAMLLAIILVCFGVLPTPAFDGITMSIGGPGGASFAAPCPVGDALVAVTALSGKDVDIVYPECALLNGGTPSPDSVELGEHGSTNANGHNDISTLVACPRDMVIQKVHASKSAAQLVHQYWLTCRNLLTGAHADTSASDTNGGKGGDPGNADCGEDSYAIGLSGRADNLVHALGLICATYHMAAPFPPTSTLPPPPPPPKKKSPLTVDNGKPPMTVDNGNG